MLFGTPKHVEEGRHLRHGCDQIEQVDTSKYLDVTLDSTMSFKDHVESLTTWASVKIPSAEV